MNQNRNIVHSTRGSSLVEILERVLDKGVVISGDIAISLADIELLTIKVRLVIASVERAQEMGIDWWQNDPQLSSLAMENSSEENMVESEKDKERLEEDRSQLKKDREQLEARIAELERKVLEKGKEE